MISSSQAHQIDAFAPLDEFLSGILPVELILNVLRAVIFLNHKDELQWCLSLSSVCHAASASVLPILYEVLFLKTTTSTARHTYTGWEGKQHKHFGLAFHS